MTVTQAKEVPSQTVAKPIKNDLTSPEADMQCLTLMNHGTNTGCFSWKIMINSINFTDTVTVTTEDCEKSPVDALREWLTNS